MKKIYHYLIAAVAVAVLGLTLGSCEVAPQDGTGAEKTEVTGDYESEVYVKEYVIGKHEFYLVYATCDGKLGHTVKECAENHCFLRHNPDCPCHKVEPSVSMNVADESEDVESSDPFDW